MDYLLVRLVGVLANPASGFSLISLLGAFGIAIAFLLARRGGRPLKFKVLLRALFPRRLAGASSRVDIAFALWSVFASGLVFALAVVSAGVVAQGVEGALSAFPSPRPALPAWACQGIATVALYLTYEVAYWSFHFACHKIPAIWAFHKVHHAAETLSPLTVARIHPVEAILFGNYLALCLGVTGGLLNFGFGEAMAPFGTQGANAIKTAILLSIFHLQHSELWIPATGRLGRLILSPAHHQIHHSADPAHFDRNFGFVLAIWDRMAGTLYVPEKTREPIRFGVPYEGYDHHGVKGALLMPFRYGWAALRPTGIRRGLSIICRATTPSRTEPLLSARREAQQ